MCVLLRMTSPSRTITVTRLITSRLRIYDHETRTRSQRVHIVILIDTYLFKHYELHSYHGLLVLRSYSPLAFESFVIILTGVSSRESLRQVIIHDSHLLEVEKIPTRRLRQVLHLHSLLNLIEHELTDAGAMIRRRCLPLLCNVKSNLGTTR